MSSTSATSSSTHPVTPRRSSSGRSQIRTWPTTHWPSASTVKPAARHASGASATVSSTSVGMTPTLRGLLLGGLLLQDLEHGALAAPALRAAARRPPRVEQRAVDVRLGDRRVDVAAPAHRARVAELLRGGVDGLDDVLLRFLLRRRCAQLDELLGGDDGAAPRPEVLGGEGRAGELAQVGVHVGAVHVDLRAVVVEVLEQLLAGQVLTRLD